MLTPPDIERVVTPHAAVAHCRLPAWEAREYVSRSANSSIGFSFTSQTCEVSVAGHSSRREVTAQSVVITGQEIVDWIRVDGPSELIEISADAALRREIADELHSASNADLADISIDFDPIAWSIAAQLRSHARGALCRDPMEIDSLVRGLYGHIYLTCFGGKLREKGVGALGARRMRRVAEFVDANLHRSLRLNDLADIAALSPFHFQRSFSRATGCTPHRFVAMRRAERATQLLESGRSEADVAKRLAFSTTFQLRRSIRLHQDRKR